LGYGAEGNTEGEDQLIKWHADELFQKMARDRDKAEAGKEAALKASNEETKI
jgi:hypothetical protein